MKNIYSTDFFLSFALHKWYNENMRSLPWRLTDNPYYIWLSEIILQQTRVDQGLPYYNEFVRAFPEVHLLAQASEDEVLKLWQGLGYYSRARNLHYTAKYIVEHYRGVFPTEYKDVIALKGVGEYTAAAIMSFAYNKPYATLDGNVFRVLSRVFGIDEYIDTVAGKKFFAELASKQLDKEQPGLYNQAIMDFGALQCVPKSPKCSMCPLSNQCYAYNNGEIENLPQKKGKTKVRDRYFNYLDIHSGSFRLFRKRKSGDIWTGLYEFPMIESKKNIPFEDLIKTEEYKRIMDSASEVNLVRIAEYKHVLSHQIIYAVFYKLETDVVNLADYSKIEDADIEKLAIPRLIEKYLIEG